MEPEKTACRCPTEWCRLEPDNGAEYCPELGPNEFCGYRPPEWTCDECAGPPRSFDEVQCIMGNCKPARAIV